MLCHQKRAAHTHSPPYAATLDVSPNPWGGARNTTKVAVRTRARRAARATRPPQEAPAATTDAYRYPRTGAATAPDGGMRCVDSSCAYIRRRDAGDDDGGPRQGAHDSGEGGGDNDVVARKAFDTCGELRSMLTGQIGSDSDAQRPKGGGLCMSRAPAQRETRIVSSTASEGNQSSWTERPEEEEEDDDGDTWRPCSRGGADDAPYEPSGLMAPGCDAQVLGSAKRRGGEADSVTEVGSSDRISVDTAWMEPQLDLDRCRHHEHHHHDDEQQRERYSEEEEEEEEERRAIPTSTPLRQRLQQHTLPPSLLDVSDGGYPARRTRRRSAAADDVNLADRRSMSNLSVLGLSDTLSSPSKQRSVRQRQSRASTNACSHHEPCPVSRRYRDGSALRPKCRRLGRYHSGESLGGDEEADSDEVGDEEGEALEQEEQDGDIGGGSAANGNDEMNMLRKRMRTRMRESVLLKHKLRSLSSHIRLGGLVQPAIEYFVGYAAADGERGENERERNCAERRKRERSVGETAHSNTTMTQAL
eukprot:GHVU01035841.1.p1 GENE.GHVU01035841.1~~GHVU01035841.1.p1  ORF type:complete len:531 (+),score=88.77 GHVU01035841.1:1086-2678(+)